MRTNIALLQKKFVDFCCRTWVQILRLRLQNWQTLNNYRIIIIYTIIGMYLHLFSGLFLPLTKHPPRNLLWRIVYESKKLKNYSWWQISDFREIALCTPVDCRNNSFVESLPSKMLLVTNFKFQTNDCREQSLRSGFAKKKVVGDKFQIPTNWLQGTILEVRFCKKKLLVTNFKFQHIDCRKQSLKSGFAKNFVGDKFQIPANWLQVHSGGRQWQVGQ